MNLDVLVHIAGRKIFSNNFIFCNGHVYPHHIMLSMGLNFIQTYDCHVIIVSTVEEIKNGDFLDF